MPENDRFKDLLDNHEKIITLTDMPDVFELMQKDINELAEMVPDIELDYAIERIIEGMTALLSKDSLAFFGTAKKTGFDEEKIKDLFEQKWLMLEEFPSPGDQYEVIVRASEFLSEWSKATGDKVPVLKKRIESDDWRIRLWGARAIRAISPDNADELLEPLQNDPFCDDNGIYLVREAAGFEME